MTDNRSFRHTSAVRLFWRLVRNTIIMLGLIILTIEISTRIIWRDADTVDLLGKEIQLLPIPIVEDWQLQILRDWYAGDDFIWQYDPILGWSVTPGNVVEFEGVVYSINSLGVRSLREYDRQKPEHVTRLAAFGPSFTFGSEVDDEFTYPAQLESLRPDIEVMNWGVGAYGTDQSWLRYQTYGMLYQPDIVLIGYEEDNYLRNVNRYRPYFLPSTGAPLTKPVFVLKDDDLLLLENPFGNFDDFYTMLQDDPQYFLAMTCPQDFFCQQARYQPSRWDVSAAYRFLRTLLFEIRFGPNSAAQVSKEEYPQAVSRHILERFTAQVEDAQAEPIVILFPQHPETIVAYEAGQTATYQQVKSFLLEQSIRVLDLTDAFIQARQNQRGTYGEFFVDRPAGHYSALGNRIVAETIVQYLCEQNLLPDCSQGVRSN